MFFSRIRSDTCRRKNQACYDTTALHVHHDHLKTLWCCICCTPMAHFQLFTITEHAQTYPNNPKHMNRWGVWFANPLLQLFVVTPIGSSHGEGDGYRWWVWEFHDYFMTLISLMLPASMKVILAQANAEDTIWIHMILHHQFYFYLRIIFFTKWFRPTTSMNCKVWRYNSWTELDGSIFLLCCSGMVTWCHGSGSEALCVSDAVQTQCINELLTAWQLPSAFASRWRIESHAAS